MPAVGLGLGLGIVLDVGGEQLEHMLCSSDGCNVQHGVPHTYELRTNIEFNTICGVGVGAIFCILRERKGHP